MPVKRSSKPKTTIGKGKKGTLKRAIYKSGGGKKTLETARSFGKTARKTLAKSKTAAQQTRGVRNQRMKRGASAKTGLKTTNPKVRTKQAKVMAKKNKK